MLLRGALPQLLLNLRHHLHQAAVDRCLHHLVHLYQQSVVEIVRNIDDNLTYVFLIEFSCIAVLLGLAGLFTGNEGDILDIRKLLAFFQNDVQAGVVGEARNGAGRTPPAWPPSPGAGAGAGSGGQPGCQGLGCALE